jgi:hypothetical protein
MVYLQSEGTGMEKPQTLNSQETVDNSNHQGRKSIHQGNPAKSGQRTMKQSLTMKGRNEEVSR